MPLRVTILVTRTDPLQPNFCNRDGRFDAVRERQIVGVKVKATSRSEPHFKSIARRQGGEPIDLVTAITFEQR